MHQEAVIAISKGSEPTKSLRHIRDASPTVAFKRLSIIIPCYNESRTIAKLLDKVSLVKLPGSIEKEIIVVDDFSKDDTSRVIQEYIEDFPDAGIRYFSHPSNQGKGAAVQTGLINATGDYVLIQDADLEYDPYEIPDLIVPILKGYADVVYGSRFKGGHPHRVLFLWHTIGNKVLTYINNLITNKHLTDAHTCYRLTRTETIRAIDLEEKRFAIDAEINIKIAQIPGIRIYEVGISYYGRTFREGKKIRFRDAIRTIYCLIKYSTFKAPNRKKCADIALMLSLNN
jgi:glycosyltransferase involved in cell wall biosynthesis